MKLKKYSVVALVLGFISALVGALTPAIYLCMQKNDSFGVIGGASVPSYRFLLFRMLNGIPIVLVTLGLAFVISAVFCLLCSKTVKENCTTSTSAISMGLSAVGASGLVAALWWWSIVAYNEMSRYPIQYPFSVALGMVSLIVFVLLLFVYFKVRNRTPSNKGIAIDVATALVFLPTFFFILIFLLNLR